MPDSGSALATATQQIDNPRTRVTHYAFKPGEATGYHRHEHDYVIVPVTNGTMRIVGPDKGETLFELRPGQSYFRNAGVEHDVINASPHDIAFVEIEFMA